MTATGDLSTAEITYEKTAHGRWYEKYSGGKSHYDRPRVSIWMPTDVPQARLQTSVHGCQEPDTLPPGAPIAYLTLAGVEIGGYLEDLEMLLAAAGDSLRWVRERYEEMRAADEPLNGGSTPSADREPTDPAQAGER